MSNSPLKKSSYYQKKRKFVPQSQEEVECDIERQNKYKLQIKNITIKTFGQQLDIATLPNPSFNYIQQNDFYNNNESPLKKNVHGYINQLVGNTTHQILNNNNIDLLSQMKQLVTQQENFHQNISNTINKNKQQLLLQPILSKQNSKKESKKAKKIQQQQQQIQQQQQQQQPQQQPQNNINSINLNKLNSFPSQYTSLKSQTEQYISSNNSVQQDFKPQENFKKSFDSLDTIDTSYQCTTTTNNKPSSQQQFQNVKKIEVASSPVPSEWSQATTMPEIKSFQYLEENKSDDLDSWFNDEVHFNGTNNSVQKKKISIFDIEEHEDFLNFDIDEAVC